jgi:hypothetical protein
MDACQQSSARSRREWKTGHSRGNATRNDFPGEHFDSATPKGRRASADDIAPAKAPLPSHQSQEAGLWAEAQTTPDAPLKELRPSYQKHPQTQGFCVS